MSIFQQRLAFEPAPAEQADVEFINLGQKLRRREVVGEHGERADRVFAQVLGQRKHGGAAIKVAHHALLKEGVRRRGDAGFGRASHARTLVEWGERLLKFGQRAPAGAGDPFGLGKRGEVTSRGRFRNPQLRTEVGHR